MMTKRLVIRTSSLIRHSSFDTRISHHSMMSMPAGQVVLGAGLDGAAGAVVVGCAGRFIMRVGGGDFLRRVEPDDHADRGGGDEHGDDKDDRRAGPGGFGRER